MAGFRKDKTTSANAAAMTAGSIVEALVTKGIIKDVDGAVEAQDALFEGIFAKLGPVVEGDNAVFEAAEAAAPAAKTAASGGKRSTTKASGGKSSGGAKFKGDRDAALEMELTSGKFKGVTLGEVLEMDADAAAEYNHREGEAGETYVQWLSTDKNPNGYTREAAQLVLDAQDG